MSNRLVNIQPEEETDIFCRCAKTNTTFHTFSDSVVITVQFSPLESVSVVCLYLGAGRFLFINVNVAPSTVCPHSIRTSLSVSTVKRALPAVTTADGFGRGSLPALQIASSTKHSRKDRTAITLVSPTC